MMFCNDTIKLLIDAKDISKRNGFGYIPEIILFGTLALQDGPLHTYLANKGLDNIKIARKVKKMYDKYFEEEKERLELFERNKEMITENPTDYQLEEKDIEDCGLEEDKYTFTRMNLIISNRDQESIQVITTTEILNIIKIAGDIAQNMFKSNINNSYMLAAIYKFMPDIYEEFISSCLGVETCNTNTRAYMNKAVKKESNLVIPESLASCLTLLNNKYSPDEKNCKILGREKETEMLIKILSKATKRNAILIGHPGVGKTAIVEKFVWNIVKENCPAKFKDYKVFSLDITSIIAGTKYRGQAEKRFQELVRFLENNPKCILFIDEIHTALGAGACREGGLDLANSLKPILARGDTQIIGATTFEEYEKYFSKDGALKRRFEKIIVREPKSQELYDMIKNQILNLEEFHHTKISKELVDFAILNASCFNYETRNPDRTLDLLDRTMAGAELKGKKEISKEDILENFDIRKKKFEKMSEKSKHATAYHEAGHYIVQRFSPELQHYNTLAISIIPAEDYLGVNVYEEDEDATPSKNRKYFIQKIAKLLGGRRAEKLYNNEISAGANADLTEATKIAKDMVTKYGLDENFTEDRVYLSESKNPMYTDKIIERISEEIDQILGEAKKYADEILKIHRHELEILVEELMKKGMVSKTELEKVFSDSQSSESITTEL